MKIWKFIICALEVIIEMIASIEVSLEMNYLYLINQWNSLPFFERNLFRFDLGLNPELGGLMVRPFNLIVPCTMVIIGILIHVVFNQFRKMIK